MTYKPTFSYACPTKKRVLIIPPLPKHVNLLATSGDCEIEAISVEGRPHLIGLQFDNHAAAPMDMRQWMTEDLEWLTRVSNLNTPALLSAAQGPWRASAKFIQKRN